METNKNLWLIPTDKPSRLSINTCFDNILELWDAIDIPKIKQDGCIQDYNICITSDEEITDGDWCYDDKYKLPFKYFGEGALLLITRKIILATDPELIKDGVQAIDDEFLEWFVKNPSCEEVIVTNLYGDYNPIEYFYEIIIPTEKRKTNLERLPFPELVKEFTDYYKNIPLVEVPKQERTYSEEDIIPLINALRYFTDRVENGTIRSKTTYKMYKEILNQFKIK